MLPSEYLCKRFGLSKAQLITYANTCPNRYKKYKILKRKGGHRKIAQPAKNLKVMQRILVNELLKKKMKIHSAATAYRANKSVVDNAVPHLNNKFLLKMDFKNFFPSITAHDFCQYLVTNGIVDSNNTHEQQLLANLLFMSEGGNLILSIGAPSSPLISNAMMFAFDQKVADLAQQNDIAYTRYSDDLTFSTNKENVLFDWPEKVAVILGEIPSPQISLNDSKTVFSSMKHNRHVTGVTITNDGKASIGRSRKREIKTRVFCLLNEGVTSDEVDSIRGLVAFANVVEPDFVARLFDKYPVQMTKLFPKKPPPLIVEF